MREVGHAPAGNPPIGDQQQAEPQRNRGPQPDRLVEADRGVESRKRWHRGGSRWRCDQGGHEVTLDRTAPVSIAGRRRIRPSFMIFVILSYVNIVG
jgi:hypothetical protein